MKNNSAISNDFYNDLGTVCDCCAFIEDAGACDGCPLKHNCLSETPAMDFVNFLTRDSIREFLDYSEDVERYVDEQDFIANMADIQRKEELWEDWTH